MFVYISIGNSDDKLTQAEWSTFYKRTDAEISTFAEEIHGRWISDPVSRYQNACWCIEINNSIDMDDLRDVLAQIAVKFKQNSIAWAAVDHTDFLGDAE